MSGRQQQLHDRTWRHRRRCGPYKCGVTFLLALFHQFGLVEGAASLSAWVEVFFMSYSIGDLLEDRPHPNRKRFVSALSLAAAIALYFVVMRIVSGRSV